MPGATCRGSECLAPISGTPAKTPASSARTAPCPRRSLPRSAAYKTQLPVSHAAHAVSRFPSVGLPNPRKSPRSRPWHRLQANRCHRLAWRRCHGRLRGDFRGFGRPTDAKRHELHEILVIGFCTLLSGGETLSLIHI